MKKNPWKVKSIQAFACLTCPECDFNTKEETSLQDHAVEKHPFSFVFCIRSIQSFTCLKCPECDFNTKEEAFFQDHAVEKHPLSFVFFGKIKSVNLLSFLILKETEDELNSSVAMQDENSVQEINTNHKTLYLDPSKKSNKSANPGNEITLQNTTTMSLDARFTHLQNTRSIHAMDQKIEKVSGSKLTPNGNCKLKNLEQNDSMIFQKIMIHTLDRC